jgi:quinol monooxygenase YgiN
MTFANVVAFSAVPGRRDELVSHLTRPSEKLAAAGCLLYEVGISDAEPDTVFVMELWRSAAAHEGSLQLPEVQEAIAQARLLLAGVAASHRFDVVGSPLQPTP